MTVRESIVIVTFEGLQCSLGPQSWLVLQSHLLPSNDVSIKLKREGHTASVEEADATNRMVTMAVQVVFIFLFL